MRRSSTSVRIQTSFLPIPGCVGGRIRSEWPSSQQQLPEPKWPLMFVRPSLCVSGSAVNVSVSCPSSSLRPSLLGSSYYDWLPSLSAGRTRKLGRRNFPELVKRSRAALWKNNGAAAPPGGRSCSIILPPLQALLNSPSIYSIQFNHTVFIPKGN
ncbi:hypothetical protein ILYODFUR_006302 [Ilyodon furcidens]|uniref:Uncharacterized protein n=1 Tax=Ilyodon furcidens TaxID=33524 RepID=A0ABV0TGE8_9TELE